MSKTKIFYCDVTASHYRTGIFKLIEEHYDVTWRFGDSHKSIKKIEEGVLKDTEQTHVYKLPFNWFWQKGIISSLTKKYNYYVMAGELYSLSVWIFLVLNKLFYKKSVYLWSHGWYGRESNIKKLLKKIFFSLPSGAFFYGYHAKEIMENQGMKVDNIYVIHNSLDYDRQISFRNEAILSSPLQKHFKNKNPNIIFIGRLTYSKKLEMIVKAATILRKEGILVNITFVGEGEAREKIERLAYENKIECWFYGACYDENLNSQLLASADICVSPGNVGLTAIHSLMFGTPVITHNNFSNQGPEFESIKEGLSGSFFKENDVNSLANTIKEWLLTQSNREIVRRQCYAEIDSFWNPEFQLKIFSNVIPFNE